MRQLNQSSENMSVQTIENNLDPMPFSVGPCAYGHSRGNLYIFVRGEQQYSYEFITKSDPLALEHVYLYWENVYIIYIFL